MATTALNSSNFKSTIESNDLVLIDFWATWCGPCRSFGPIFEKASEEHPDIVFGKVDIDQNQQIAAANDIQAVPTLMITKGGQVIFKQAGALRASDLAEVITKAQEFNASEANA